MMPSYFMCLNLQQEECYSTIWLVYLLTVSNIFEDGIVLKLNVLYVFLCRKRKGGLMSQKQDFILEKLYWR